MSEARSPSRPADPVDLRALQTRRELISHWMGLLRSVRLYDLGNETVTSLAGRILACTRRLVAGGAELEFLVRQDSIFIGGERVRESTVASSAYHAFVDLLSRAGLAAFRLDAETAPRELASFAQLLAEVGAGERAREELASELSVRGISRVEVLLADDTALLSPRSLDREQITKRVYLRSIGVVKGVFHSMSRDGRVNARMVKRAVQQMVETVDSDYLLNLTSLKNYDEYTFNHSVNVSVLAIALGRRVGLSRHQLYVLGQAGMLHDLGKLCVPREVLNKPGKLTPEERAVIESHPIEGFLAIASSLGVADETIPVALAAFQHHVNLDGTGYPQLVGDPSLGLLSRIVAVVDRYDAMTSARVYRKQPIPPWKALAIMYHRHAGHYDGALLRTFMNLLGAFPLGTAVELSDGCIAVVVGGNPEPRLRHLPMVRVLLDAGGQPANEVVDLAAHAKDAEPLAVRQVVDPDAYGIEIMDYLL